MKMPKAHPISWILLLVTTLAILATSVSRIILPTVLPAIMEEFQWSATRDIKATLLPWSVCLGTG